MVNLNRVGWIRTPVTNAHPFSLAQVCRQIRHEYLPIIKTRTKICILHFDLNECLQTHVQTLDIRDEYLAGMPVLFSRSSHYDADNVTTMIPTILPTNTTTTMWGQVQSFRVCRRLTTGLPLEQSRRVLQGQQTQDRSQATHQIGSSTVKFSDRVRF